MCECLQKISNSYSEKFRQNDKNACVQVSIIAAVDIKPWVIEKKPYREKILRRAKKGHHFGVELKFCPICGKPSEGYQQATTWND